MHLIIVVVVLTALAITLGQVFIAPHNSLPARTGAPLPMKSLKGAILQLELARNERDLTEILLPGSDSEARRRNVEDARAGNRADSVFFIPLYTLALAATGLLVVRGHASSGARLFGVFVAVSVAIAAFDYVENAGIERTLRHIEQSGTPQPGDAAAIANASRVKWVLLTALLAVYAIFAATSHEPSVRWFSVFPLALACLLGYTLTRYFIEWRALRR